MEEALSPEERSQLQETLVRVLKNTEQHKEHQKNLLRRLGAPANLEDRRSFWAFLKGAARRAGNYSEDEFWNLDVDELCAVLELHAHELERIPHPVAATAKRAAAAVQQETPENRAKRRQAVVMPILERKRWTRGILVTKSGLGKATVYGYLDGSRRHISPASRRAIVESLQIELKSLPL